MNNYFKTLMRQIDSVEVGCYNGNDTVKHFVINAKLIQDFTEVITGKQTLQKIDTTKIGYLSYYDKNTLKLKIDMLNEGVKYNYKNKNIFSLSSYQTSMLFLETCNASGFNIKD